MNINGKAIAENWHGIHPQIMLLLGAFSAMLAYYNLEFIYHCAIILFIITILMSGIRIQSLTRIVFFVFVVNIIFVCIATILFNEGLDVALNAIRRYWLPLIYASLLSGKIATLADTRYYQVWYKTLLLLTFFAYIQYFVSTDLWGIIPSDRTTLTEWSVGMDFVEYAVFFRAFSLMGSPQIWGLYSALSILVLSSVNNVKINNISIWFLWIGSFLSGNKVTFLLFCIYFVKVLINNKSRTFRFGFIIFFCVGLFTFSQKNVYENIRVIEHVFNISEIAEQENVGRFARWKNAFEKINPVFGGGASFFKKPSNLENPAESYLLQSFVEISVIYPIFFLLILVYNFAFLKNNRTLVIGLFVATTSSAAFDHPAFISFWLLLIGIGLSSSSRKFIATSSFRSIPR